MEIVMAATGLAIGPDILNQKSLGGSETAFICMAQELVKLGNQVTVFAPLVPEIPNGYMADPKNIKWVNIDQFLPYISNTECDLCIVSRTPQLLRINHQAKKMVYWLHDLATYQHFVPAFQSVSFNIDEIWTVSEFHRQQIHKVTGYPLEYIRATRNGIARYETMDLGRVPKQLLYAARPERGLENLVRPGGIMSRLPDYTLKVSMYDNHPPQVQDYYAQLFAWARELPNVELLGHLKQGELRQLMRSSSAYVYPTNFEEVSCIIGRECIEQQLPFFTSNVGALKETLQDCAVYVFDEKVVWDDERCQRFANVVKDNLEDNFTLMEIMQQKMAARTDLYWPEVAQQWMSWSGIRDQVTHFSRAWSLVEDSDVIPAIAYLNKHYDELGYNALSLLKQIIEIYPYLFGRETFESYYERYYEQEDKKEGSRAKHDNSHTARWQAIAASIAHLEPGSVVLDYGCAEGVIINDLAKKFPQFTFVGIDFAASNVRLAATYAAEDSLTNVYHVEGSSTAWPSVELAPGKPFPLEFDAVICSEVLEHVTEPWTLISFLEKKVKIGGRVVITVPHGPWEMIGLRQKEQWTWRAHIWHINKWMLRLMFADKKNCQMAMLTSGHATDGRSIGHLTFAYEADHKVVYAIDSYKKALHHRSRQSCAAAIIAKDAEETILKTLNSIKQDVQMIQIALGPTDDATLRLIRYWAENHPWIAVKVINAPAIEANKYGFDDARNLSTLNIDTDWILWIDTDEYLSRTFSRYLRANAFDGYAISQHHFTVDPKGHPAQIDKPVRLYRTNRGYHFYGKVHEHAEKGDNAGPGFCYLLPDIDIGHTGYVNESVRRRRFDRNFPLLEWDRKVNPQRKLGKFLWLRDLVQRMRHMVEIKNVPEARLLAGQAIEFYRANWDSFDRDGQGGMQAVTYYSEAMAFLGEGIAVEFQIRLDANGPQIPVAGVFADEQEAIKLIGQVLKPEFDRRKSGYY